MKKNKRCFWLCLLKSGDNIVYFLFKLFKILILKIDKFYGIYNFVVIGLKECFCLFLILIINVIIFFVLFVCVWELFVNDKNNCCI